MKNYESPQEAYHSLKKDYKEVFPFCPYTEAPQLVSQAADYLNITGKRVLVIGTETPWLEAVLLQRRPRYVELMLCAQFCGLWLNIFPILLDFGI